MPWSTLPTQPTVACVLVHLYLKLLIACVLESNVDIKRCLQFSFRVETLYEDVQIKGREDKNDDTSVSFVCPRKVGN